MWRQSLTINSNYQRPEKTKITKYAFILGRREEGEEIGSFHSEIACDIRTLIQGQIILQH